MNTTLIQHHPGFSKYVRPALIITGVVLTVTTLALAILLVAPSLVPAAAVLSAKTKLLLTTGTALLATTLLGASGKQPTVRAARVVYPVLSLDEIKTAHQALIQVIRENLTTEGLFRVPGDVNKVNEYLSKLLFNTATDGLNVHDVCSALKKLHTVYKIQLNLNELNYQEAKKAFHELCEEKKAILSSTLTLLTDIESHQRENKMSFENLGIVAHSMLFDVDTGENIGLLKQLNALATQILRHKDDFLL